MKVISYTDDTKSLANAADQCELKLTLVNKNKEYPDQKYNKNFCTCLDFLQKTCKNVNFVSLHEVYFNKFSKFNGM